MTDTTKDSVALPEELLLASQSRLGAFRETTDPDEQYLWDEIDRAVGEVRTLRAENADLRKAVDGSKELIGTLRAENERLRGAMPPDEQLDAIVACLGDDAASLRADNDEDERAANMEAAADAITALRAQLAEAQKDVERLDWMQFHGAKVGWGRDGEHCSVVWSDDDGVWHDSGIFTDWRAAIDAAKGGGNG